jgi:hypothetical protein
MRRSQLQPPHPIAVGTSEAEVDFLAAWWRCDDGSVSLVAST